MTHASFAVVDHDRNRPTVPGRRNRDYSIFDFKEGGRFYTIFPYFHVSLKVKSATTKISLLSLQISWLDSCAWSVGHIVSCGIYSELIRDSEPDLD